MDESEMDHRKILLYPLFLSPFFTCLQQTCIHKTESNSHSIVMIIPVGLRRLPEDIVSGSRKCELYIMLMELYTRLVSVRTGFLEVFSFLFQQDGFENSIHVERS